MTELTIYPDQGQITKRVIFDTIQDKILDIPENAYDPVAITYIHEKLFMLKLIKQRTQLIIKPVPPYVQVTLADGKKISGELDAISLSKIELTDEDDNKLYITDYKSLEFIERYTGYTFGLSYMLEGIQWKARHILFLSGDAISAFKTFADIVNSTGNTFVVDNLILGLGRPKVRPQMEYKASMLASAPPIISSREKLTTKEIKDDYAKISLGPRTLNASAEIEISTGGIKVEKIFVHQLTNGNRTVDNGYRLSTEERIIPEGELFVYDGLNLVGTDTISRTLWKTTYDVVLGKAVAIEAVTSVGSAVEHKAREETKQSMISEEQSGTERKQAIETIEVKSRLLNRTANPQKILLILPISGIIKNISEKPDKVDPGRIEFLRSLDPQKEVEFVLNVEFQRDMGIIY